MAMDVKGTKLANLINPEVLTDYINVKLMDRIKLSPLMVVNNDLVGVGGDTLTLPVYNKLGTGVEVAEGEDIPVNQLQAESRDVKVKKIGIGAQLSIEAIISSYGDPVNQVGKQLLDGIAEKIEKDAYAVLDTATLTHSCAGAFDKAELAKALVKFGEEIEDEMFLFINPATYAEIRANQDFVEIANGQAVISGEVGVFMGCKVVVANRVGAQKAYVIKRGALQLVMKRSVMVEDEKNIVNQTYRWVATEHYAVHMLDESKAIAITLQA